LSAVGDGFLVRSLASTFRSGGEIGRHDHPWGQLVHATSGVMRVSTTGRAWLIPPGRAIWLPPRLPHAIVMKGEVALRTLYLDPDLAEPLPKQEQALGVTPLLREVILYILKIGMLHPAKPPQRRLADLLIDLLTEAEREDFSLALPKDRAALAMAEHLLSAPAERLDLAAAARAAGASLRTLQRRFPDQTGLTLEAWRRKARLIHALGALSAGAPVTVAALECGYDSLSAFITAFRRQFGETPGRYRGGV
jgi:AraC-like DNA-binding protein